MRGDGSFLVVVVTCLYDSVVKRGEARKTHTCATVTSPNPPVMKISNFDKRLILSRVVDSLKEGIVVLVMRDGVRSIILPCLSGICEGLL